jgi:hypothetical protein
MMGNDIFPGYDDAAELIPQECFPLPGDKFILSNIFSKAGLVHTSRSNPIFSARQGYPNILILSQLYKNDWAMCIALRDQIKEWVKDQTQPFLNETSSLVN